jgi:voltage-gated potassium channel
MTRLINATDTFKELAAIYLIVVSLGAVVFHFAEDKPLLDAFWWAFVTALTVGYGDIVPVTLIGRIDGVVLMHVVPLFIVPLIVARLLDRMLIDRDRFSHEEQEVLKRDLAEIKKALGIDKPAA